MTLSPHIERRVLWALAIGTALLGLVRLGASDVVDPEEARALGIVQDILRGHVLWPTFNDGVIPREPPGFHWLVAAAVRAGGFSELVVRLPGVAAWVALVLLTARLGRDLGAGAAGLGAALLLAATPGLAGAARTARPDTTVAALLSAAMLFAWRWVRDDRPRDAWAAVAYTTAATFAGGPSAPVLVLAATAWALGAAGETGRLWRLASPARTAAVVALAGAWYAGGVAALGAPFALRHAGGGQLLHLARAFTWAEPWASHSVLSHVAFHPIGLVRMTMPWTPLAIVAGIALVRGRPTRDRRIRFLVAWAVAPLLLFVWTRHQDWADMLVALPPVALLAANAALGLLGRWPRPLRVDAAAMATAGAAAVVLVAAFSVVVYHPGLLPRGDRNRVEDLLAATGGPAPVLAGAAAIGGLGAGLVAARAWPLVPPTLAVLGLAWNLLAQPAVEYAASETGSLRSFAATIARIVEPDDPVVFYARTEPPLVVYLDRVVPSLRRDRDRLPTGAFAILRARHYDELAPSGRLSPIIAHGSGRMHDGRPGHLVLARVLAPPPPRRAGARR